MSMFNNGGSELGSIRCRECGCVFGTEGIHIDITTNRFYVPQMGEIRGKGGENENKVQEQIQCPHCGQEIVTTINY